VLLNKQADRTILHSINKSAFLFWFESQK